MAKNLAHLDFDEDDEDFSDFQPIRRTTKLPKEDIHDTRKRVKRRVIKPEWQINEKD